MKRDILASDLTFDKVTNALKRLKQNKTSGCDGLTPEILVALWDEL